MAGSTPDRGVPKMMLAVFATLSLALLAAYFGPRWLAIVFLLVCLALSVGLFLFEIYSPEYGFRMPWLQVYFDAPPPIGPERAPS
jgi:hypothetical protein